MVGDEQQEQQEQSDARKPPPEHRSKPAGAPTDYMANERTLLAWVRTGIALVGLGFVVARFGLYLREIGARVGLVIPAAFGGHASSIFGTLIVMLGALLLGLGYLSYRSTARALTQGEYRDSSVLVTGSVAIVILIALGLAIYLLLTS